MDTQQHFSNLLDALRTEKKEEQEQYKLLTENAAIKDRVEAGITLYPLEFLKLDYNDSGDLHIRSLVNSSQEGSSFSEGSTVSFFNADGEEAQGQCVNFRGDTIQVKVQDEAIQEWIKKGKIGLNAIVDTKTYDLFEKTLKTILSEEPYPLLDYFYQLKNEGEAGDDAFPNLNQAQNVAVNQIVSDKRVTVVHGPPGTGKTTTLVAAIKTLAENKKRILLCTPSNAAVDNVCRKLLKEKIKVVRIGNEAKVDKTVSSAFLENQIRADRSYKLLTQLKSQAANIREQAFKFKRNFGKEEYEERRRLKNELKALRTDIRQIQNNIARGIIDEAEVIAGTFYGVQGIASMLDQFDYVIIDEAGQAIEPAIWSVAHFGKQLVVAGDDLQLPPTVKSSNAQRLGLDKSLLQIATEISFPKHLLNVQYRMNQKIMGFSNQHFYGGKLEAHDSVAQSKIEGNINEAIEFIDTAGCGYEEDKKEDGGGISNLGEIGVIQKVLREYVPEKYSIGIITPYRAQLNAINESLSSENFESNTVDSFQGQERDIIIISLVRSNENADIGFLKDYRRMNVAMTRAKMKLVVIGDSATIGQDKFYADFLDYVETTGTYRTAWEFM